jgi:excisionase family DNA binding protein
VIDQVWLNIEDVEKVFKVHRDTVYRWIESKGFPAHRMGRFYKFKMAEIESWMDGGDRKPNVLVVDDDKVDLKVIQNGIKELANVQTAASAKEALELLKVNNFDILITDLFMSELDGVDLLKRVNKIKSNITTIVITGQKSPESEVTVLNAGAYLFLEKKDMPENLKEAIARIWHGVKAEVLS